MPAPPGEYEERFHTPGGVEGVAGRAEGDHAVGGDGGRQRGRLERRLGRVSGAEELGLVRRLQIAGRERRRRDQTVVQQPALVGSQRHLQPTDQPISSKSRMRVIPFK